MKLKILAFGITKDIFGTSQQEITIKDAITVQQLKSILEEEFPELKKLRSYFIAVNEEYAEEDRMITETDEIAIIPPVSGG
ncbi:molybdopterin converting factor [Chryseobacterium gallinarum]|uniref:Molybdopterin synthase sulfur carrier subunit n=1 Tax=Chryseobacterium gallinarum TaxID=1324352 RepID=A0A0G3MA71_CHRGL|nr:molybdopterin converting factor subunit 1 [Chryseobacterium gallinarum]AKK73962.1 molybdopterin converting factor [Chryseobacterium gallinarum]MCL8537769.1 molybdopterin converting factor subunit 1 [Chryseobacterium gallinarum]